MYEAYGINEPLARYRKVSGSISSNKIKALKRTWNTYKNIVKLPFPKLYYVFTCYVINAIRANLTQVNEEIFIIIY